MNHFDSERRAAEITGDFANKRAARFTLIGSHTVPLTQTSMHVNKTKYLHLVGVKVKSYCEITLVSTDPDVVSASIHKAPYDGPKGIWCVDLKSHGRGVAEIQVKVADETVAVLGVETVAMNAVMLPVFRTESRATGFAEKPGEKKAETKNRKVT